jgi:MYXO-CTERM domain-containing protein
MVLDMKRMVVLGLVVVGVFLPAARAVAQEGGAAGADVIGDAGADNAGAGAGGGGGAHGGSGGAGVGAAAVGGKTSYDLVKNDAGQACSIGHGADSGGLALVLGAAGLLAALRRRQAR